MLTRALHRHVLARRWAAFVVLGLSFLLFGAGSLNIVFLLQANLALIAEHGWQALADGAAWQLLEIVATGYVSMLAYIVFKVCEYSLVHGLIHPPAQDPHS
jgi:predicted PurR-regulated permease PerM